MDFYVYQNVMIWEKKDLSVFSMASAASRFLWHLENESYFYEASHRHMEDLNKEESDGKASGKIALYFSMNKL